MKSSKQTTRTNAFSDVKWLLIIIGLALIVRIVFWIESAQDPIRDSLFLDSNVYHLLAAEIAEENFWGHEVFFRAPLFPYALGIMYILFGIGLTAARVLHLLLGIATVLLTYRIAELHFKTGIARIAGVATALYPTLYFFEMRIMPTTLEVFTFTLPLYFLTLYQMRKQNRFLIWSGVALGVAALARPTILSFVLALVLWLIMAKSRDSWTQKMKRVLLLVVPTFATIAPVTLRNYLIEPDFVLISSQGGANFSIGFNKNADGQSVAFVPPSGPLNKYDDHVWTESKSWAERQLKRKLTASEVSSYWFDQGWDYVKSEPVRAVGLFFKKIYYFFCGEELFNNEDPLAEREYAPLYSMFVWNRGLRFPYGLLAPLFLVGTLILITSKEKRSLLLLFIYSQVASLSLFFISSRFRQPLIPAMVIVAVFSACYLYQIARGGRVMTLMAYLLPIVLLGFALNPPVVIASKENHSMYHIILADALVDQGKYDLALAEAEKALEIHSGNMTALEMVASIYARQGRFEDALRVLRQTEAIAPSDLGTQALLGKIRYDLGQYAEALSYFDKVLSAGSKDLLLLLGGARASIQVGDFAKAMRYLQTILSSDPANEEALLLLDSLNVQN